MGYQNKRKSKGFTLTEIAIVLAIVGLILGAIWVAAKSVMDANRATQAVQDITTIASNMRSTFSAQSSFASAGNQTASMITAGIIPTNLVASGGTTATNSWQGQIIIYLGVPDARHFRVSYYGTPHDACFRIASQIMNIGTSDSAVDFVTNSGASGAISTATTAAIDAACTLNGSGTSVSAAASTEFDYTIH